MATTDAPALQEDEFQDTPEGWSERLTMEFAAARREVERWHKQGKDIIAKFRDERTDDTIDGVKWNVFTSNIQTQRAMMYGRVPSVTVTRKFQDANDDVARVAGDMQERLLNCDITRDSDGYVTGLGYALDDFLLPGHASVRLRYVVEMEDVQQPPILHPETGQELEPAQTIQQKKQGSEDVEVDYVQWNDQLWSAGARTFHEVRWWAFKAQMTRQELVKRFGEDIGKRVPLNAKRPKVAEDTPRGQNPWSRADVWEVWDKEHKKVIWYVEGFGKALEVQDDTLGLQAFWPFPRPMIANRTNNTLVPRPDFALYQDQYNEVDEITARIGLLARALRVAGVYDKTAGDLGRLVNETRINEMVPVDNWAMFAEKGGIKGQMELLPIFEIAQTMDKLRDYRQEILQGLYQTTGFSDIMRGQSAEAGVTATEQGIKARFASVRMQALQDEFARFASDVQRIKGEIICKFFDDESIIQRSNIQFTEDAQYAKQAIQLLRDRYSDYRIEVKPESVSLTDFAALKAERTEFMMGLSTYFQAVAPIGQAMPGALPYLLEMAKWFVAGMKGSSGIESVFDRAITQAQQMAQNPQPQQQGPTPEQVKMQTQQLKGQQDMQKIAAQTQARLQERQMDIVAKDKEEESQAKWNTIEAAAKHRITKTLGGVANSGLGGPMP